VTLEVSINLNSLQVIREELDNTLNQSATDFEAYLADTQSVGHLESSWQKIAQVGGTFRLLQYPGAALLADEMAALGEVIADEGQKTTSAMIEALTQCYFVLPRYIEYVVLKKEELPILVLPYVNELRVSRKAPLLPEYVFFEHDIPTECSLVMDGYCQTEELLSTVGRLRHMYQVGLLGILKEPYSAFHYGLMARAVTRVASLVGNHASADVWQLAGAVLECFAAGKLEPTLNRKRNLADIEKLMRVIVSLGEAGLDQLNAEALKKDMLFMLMLSSHSSKIVDALQKLYKLPPLIMTDDEIIAQREVMQGPSTETIESVVKVLKEELRNAKDILEISSQNDGIEAEDLSSLREVVTKVADTLGILNLEGPRTTLIEQVERMEQWGNAVLDVGRSDFLETADAVLYVDSALSGLDRRELTVADLREASAVARKKVIASSHLAEAQAVVLEEAQAGIALAKRAITSYVDSSFDIAHISNVGTTLNTVRGGLHILKYYRAAAVLKSCSDFMDSHVQDSDPSNQRHQLLETLADALISLEYYLMEMESTGQGNEKILEVAEESLAALGFAVSA
jgi:scaffold protein FimL